jgi:2-dehydropantoate 2-reductase
MKVTIVGAGAIGGFIGARLASLPQVSVSAVARGATQDALRRFGWRLQLPDQLINAPCAAATEDAAQLGLQDLVVIAVKAPALPNLATQLSPLIGAKTLILPAMNGVPWWFMQAHRGSPMGRDEDQLLSVDPTGSIAKHLPGAQSLGCVVHASTFTPEPGLVQVKIGNGLIIGDPWHVAGSTIPDRSLPIVELLSSAGFAATHSNHIRYDIWYKLWGNMTVNPITAVTGSTADQLFDDELVRNLCSQCMLEAGRVGAQIGCNVTQTPEDRHQITRRLGAFKTSMLQDIEAGRTIELDALVGVVRELGVKVGVATPMIDSLFGLTRLFARNKGLYP